MNPRRLAIVLAAIVLLATMVEYALILAPAISVATGGTIISEN
jgi:hypothetical protein